MRRFTQLIRDLDERIRSADKQSLLEAYFREVPPADGAWALWFLWGNRLPTRISPRRLAQWSRDITGYPEWLVASCYSVAGDLGETSALLLPAEKEALDLPLSAVVEEQLKPLSQWDERFQFYLYRKLMDSLDPDQASIVHKILAGPLRIGISRRLLVKSLAGCLQVPASSLAGSLAGDWSPGARLFPSLRRAGAVGHEPPGDSDPALSRLLQDLEDEPADEGHEPRFRARLVLLYAHAGRGGGQASYTDLTLAARDGDRLVGVAKTDSSLDSGDKKILDHWIRENTLARRGPVRTVPPKWVFEVGFARVRSSRRRTSGLELRFPMIMAWLKESGPGEADTLEDLKKLRDAQVD